MRKQNHALSVATAILLNNSVPFDSAQVDIRRQRESRKGDTAQMRLPLVFRAGDVL